MKLKLLTVLSLSFSTIYLAQVGINTQSPQGIFHIDGNKDNVASPTVAQQADDFVVKADGSAGIGTTTINSSAKLKINATNQGVLIPRVTLQTATDGTTILSPAKGLIVYNTNTNAVLDEGFYVNYGTDIAPQWKSFRKYEKSAWILENIFDIAATAPVDRTVTSATQTINDVNLGLTITVTVPPFMQSKISSIYSVPIGTTTASTGFNGYYGIRFLKDGNELQEGSRKYSINPNISGIAARMSSITASVAETIVNNTALPITVTYTLNGYIETANNNTSGSTIRFNMWAATGANFNWGKEYMSVQQFLKPL